MKKTLIIFLLSLIMSMLHAQESTSAYGILKLPISAHAAALGGENITGLDEDPSVVMHNPALLSNVDDPTLGLSFMSYAEQSRWLGAQWVGSWSKRHTVAAFGQYMGYGEMIERDEMGNAMGVFNPKDLILGVGYSYLLNSKWAGGANFKMIYSNIGIYHAIALAMDLGLNYYDPENDMSISIVARNLGAQLKAYDRKTETVPYSFQLGYSKGLEHLPLRWHLTLVDLTRWTTTDYYRAAEQKMTLGRMMLNHLVLGVDWLLSNTMSFTAGYNFRRGYELQTAGRSQWTGLSLGTSLKFTKVKINVAWAQYHRSTGALLGTASYTF